MKNLIATSALLFTVLCSNAQAELICKGIATDSPKISGLYVDNFAGWHSVGQESWLMLSGASQLSFHVCSVDNTKNFLIAQNSPANDFNPSKYSRFEWGGSKGQLFYCQQVFDADSAADAADFVKYPAADASDQNDTGCGATKQFAWSQLSLVRR